MANNNQVAIAAVVEFRVAHFARPSCVDSVSCFQIDVDAVVVSSITRTITRSNNSGSRHVEVLIVVVVDAKPKGVFEFGHVVAAREADVVAPGMAKTRVLGLHEGADAGVHDAVKRTDLQKRPSFVAIQDHLAEFGFNGIECTLRSGRKTKEQTKNI